MAARYWVAASNTTWTDTNNWSTTSGGTPGASVPGIDDDVIFDNGSTKNCGPGSNISIKSFTVSSNCTMCFYDNGRTITVYGTINIASIANKVVSTGTWILAANGNLANAMFSSNIIGTLKILTGVTGTCITTFCCKHLIVEGTGGTASISGIIVLPPVGENNCITLSTTSNVYNIYLYMQTVGQTYSQGYLRLLGNFYYQYSPSTSITMTDHWTMVAMNLFGGSNDLHVSESASAILDTNGFNLTLSNALRLGASTSGYNGYNGKILLRNGTHTFSTIWTHDNGYHTHGWIDWGTSIVTITGDLDLRAIGMSGGTSNIHFTTDVTHNIWSYRKTLNSITVEAGTLKLCDDLRVGTLVNSGNPVNLNGFILVDDPNANWLDGFQYRKKITVSHTQIDEYLTDFTLYVPLRNDADVAKGCLPTGYDIRFTLADGTVLPYERSWFQVANSMASGDFYIQTDLPADKDTVIYMYWGNGNASNVSNSVNAWDIHAAGVWHLEDGVDSAAGSNLSAAGAGTVSYSTGVINKGATFANGYLTGSSNAKLQKVIDSKHFTITGWFKNNDTAQTATVLEYAADRYRIRYNTGGTRKYEIYANGGVFLYTVNTLAVDDNSWHFMGISYDKVTGQFITNIDGTSQTFSYNVDTTGTGTGLTVGSNAGGTAIFNGSIDELRIFAIDRTGDWMKFEYYNTGSVGNQISVGDIESLQALVQWGANSGINFLFHTDDLDINVVNSGYMLGFAGVGAGTLKQGEWNSTTYLTNQNNNVLEVQCRNIRYAGPDTAYVDGMSVPLPLINIPNYQSTVNIRFVNNSDVKVVLAKCRFYDRTKTINDPPTGLDIRVAEIVHSSLLQTEGRGLGSREWIDVSNGEWFTLSRSPGPAGVNGGGYGSYRATVHDWYLAISVAPKPIGTRSNIGLEVYLEYL